MDTHCDTAVHSHPVLSVPPPPSLPQGSPHTTQVIPRCTETHQQFVHMLQVQNETIFVPGTPVYEKMKCVIDHHLRRTQASVTLLACALVVNYPWPEAGSFNAVARVGSFQANQFVSYRQANCRSKKKLAFCVARTDKAVPFLPTTLRRGTCRNAIRLQTCSEPTCLILGRKEKAESHVRPSLPLLRKLKGCGGPYLNF